MHACGIIDAARILFMVPGHTKFGPDFVARAVAGEYNKKDVLNQALLVECAEDYGHAQYTMSLICSTERQRLTKCLPLSKTSLKIVTLL